MLHRNAAAALFREGARREFQRCRQMLSEVLRIVTARIEVILVRDVALTQDFVEGGGAGFETVIVAITAVEVDLQAGEIGGAREGDGTVAIPEGWIRRGAE